MEAYQIFEIFVSILAGGVATTLAVQLLKSKFIPFIPAEKYPRITAAVVSAVASVAALVQSGVTWAFVTSTPEVIVAVVGGTLLVAASVYNNVVKSSATAGEPAPVDAADDSPQVVEAEEEQPQPEEPSAPEEAPEEPKPVSVTDGEETYVVEPGDTVTKAAAKLNVSPESLAEANGLEVGSVLDIGQILRVQR